MTKAALPTLLAQMDQVDQALGQGVIPDGDAGAQAAVLDPATEATLPVLQALYQEQENRTLPTPWLRRVLARPFVKSSAEAIEKLRRDIATAKANIRRSHLFVNGGLILGMCVLGGAYRHLSVLLNTAAHAPDSPAGQAALAQIMVIVHHPNLIMGGLLGLLALVMGPMILGRLIEARATERLQCLQSSNV